ncbi:sugar ABC transporter substrate-binding protein [Anaerosacchariphilus polymeriproducens]|nr:sugar ABC transporter substrate-binding protein [Anaerosacchariphilus polymeriproducens]
MRFKQNQIERARRKVFGVAMPTIANTFFVVLNNGLNTIVEENGDILITLIANYDQELQNAQVQKFIDEKVDFIFIIPVDSETVKPALEASREAGIPVINIDTPVYDKELVLSIISSDNYKIGTLIGLDLIQRLNSAKIVIIDFPESVSTTNRVNGFMDIIKDKPQYEVVEILPGDTQYLNSKKAMESVIDSGIEFNVVMAVNDLSAFGAMDALDEAGINSGILIYGVDGSPEAKRLIAQGKMTASVAQSPNELGMYSAEMAYVYLEGKPISDRIFIPVYLIDQQNVYDYGLISWN